MVTLTVWLDLTLIVILVLGSQTRLHSLECKQICRILTLTLTVTLLTITHALRQIQSINAHLITIFNKEASLTPLQ